MNKATRRKWLSILTGGLMMCFAFAVGLLPKDKTVDAETINPTEKKEVLVNIAADGIFMHGLDSKITGLVYEEEPLLDENGVQVMDKNGNPCTKSKLVETSINEEKIKQSLREYLELMAGDETDRTATTKFLFNANYSRAATPSQVIDNPLYSYTYDEDGNVKKDANGDLIKKPSGDFIGADQHWQDTARALLEYDIDVYEYVIELAKEMGAEAWISFRMNEYHWYGTDAYSTFISQDEANRRNPLGNCMNYGHDSAKTYISNYIQEVVAYYDISGVEFDFLRCPFLYGGVTDENVSDLNNFVGELYDTVKGIKNIDVYARAFYSMDKNAGYNIHPEQWIANGDIDGLIISESDNIDYDYPVQDWRDKIAELNTDNHEYQLICGGSLYNFVDGKKPRNYVMDDAAFRGFAYMAYAKGADGVYTFNTYGPAAQVRHVYDEEGNLIACNAGTKAGLTACYEDLGCLADTDSSLRRHIITTEMSMLPELTNGESWSYDLVTGKTQGYYKVYIGLNGEYTGYDTADIGVSVNGKELKFKENLATPVEDCGAHGTTRYAHISEVGDRVMLLYLDDLSVLQDGANTIEITNNSADTQKITWVQVDISSKPEKEFTIDLNGGFQITDTANSVYSEEDVSVVVTTETDGTITLTHDVVRAMFHNAPVYLKSTTSGADLYASNFTGTQTYDRITNNVIVHDENGYYNPAKGNGSIPSLLFGLFVDTDDDGELDENETLYQSGDTIDLTDVSVLKCYYNPNVYYCTNENAKANNNIYVALQKGYKYFGNTNSIKNNVYADEARTQLLTSVTARDLQPLYHELAMITSYAFHNSCMNSNVYSITNIELPTTVTFLNSNAFVGLYNLQTIEGTDNVATVGVNAFRYVGSNNALNRWVLSPTTVYGGAFNNAKNARLIITGTNAANKSTVLSSYFFHSNVGAETTKDLVNHKGYVYVPYGETADWYPETITNTSFEAIVADDGTVTRVNAPMREFYEIRFDLNGGTINGQSTVDCTYMDARAVSVLRNGAENNLTTDKTATNDAAQNIALLPAENPGIPVKKNAVFAGWKDQYGNIWTTQDLLDGGKSVSYNSGIIELTATYDLAVEFEIDLNGGFQILDTANSVYSDENLTVSVKLEEDGTFTFTHDAVRELFGYNPVYKKATEAPIFDYSYTKITCTIAYDGTGFYNPTSKEGTLPDLLFGLFVDMDGDGVLDDGETLYQSGDTIDMKGVTKLTCYYNDDIWFSTLQANTTGDQNLQVALQKVSRYASSKTSNGYFMDKEGNTITVVTARDLQPFYHEVAEIAQYACVTFNQNTTITDFEIPETVTALHTNSMYGLKKAQIKGLENIKEVYNQALGQVGASLSATTATRLVMAPTKIYDGAFRYANNVRLILTGTEAANKSTVLSGYFFHQNNGTETTKSLTAPKGYIYVPYGETAQWYPETITNTSFEAIVADDGTVTRVNAAMREMYTVQFNLNGGTVNGATNIPHTYMDARAVSVLRNGVENNLTTAKTATNPAEQTLSLLPAEKPAVDPVGPNGEKFLGWKDQNGKLWTADDWTNGGVGGYETAIVTLTAVYGATVYGGSLSLNGKIGLNVYLDLDDLVVADENATVTLTTNDGNKHVINVADVKDKKVDGYYPFSIAYAPFEVMSKTITGYKVSFTVEGTLYETENAITFNVETYKNAIQEGDADEALVNALTDYCTASEAWMDKAGVIETVTDETITADALASYAISVEGTDENVTIAGVTLVMNSGTDLRLYFTGDVECRVNGEVCEAQQGVGSYAAYKYIEISLPAAELDTTVTFTVGGITVKASAFSYIYNVLSLGDGASLNLQNLVKWMYLYNQAANEYFGA